MSRESIVVLLPRLPLPVTSGGSLKCFHLLEALRVKFEIKLLIITLEKDTKFHHTEEYCKKYSISLHIERVNVFEGVLNILAGLFGRKPLQVLLFKSKKFQKLVDHALHNSNLIVANMLRTSQFVENVKVPKIFDIVDSYYLSYVNASEKTKSLLYKLIYRVEAPRLYRYEKYIIERFSSSVFVNFLEADYWRSIGRCDSIPNGVASNDKISEVQTIGELQNKNYVYFFGKMDYPPNVDAVLWFTNHVMPLLPKDILFVIIGSNPNKQILELARKLPERIIVTGFILSPAAIFQGAICSVAPMQTGSGIQNKILESMAAGNVVITSSLAAKPLAGAIDGIHFLVSDSPNDFSAKIIGLLENRYDVGNMKNAAKELMMKQYSWDKHYAAWQKLVDEILYEN